MNILSLFVLIPLLMLLGLWIARNVNQVRGVMVAGSTLLLALAAYLTVSYIGQRHAGATAEMLFTDSIVWYVDGKPVHKATVEIPAYEQQIMMNLWNIAETGPDDWAGVYKGDLGTAYYEWVGFDAAA